MSQNATSSLYAYEVVVIMKNCFTEKIIQYVYLFPSSIGTANKCKTEGWCAILYLGSEYLEE